MSEIFEFTFFNYLHSAMERIPSQFVLLRSCLREEVGLLFCFQLSLVISIVGGDLIYMLMVASEAAKERCYPQTLAIV